MQNNVFYKHIGDYFMIKRHKLIGFAAVAAFFLLLSCKNNLSPEIPVEDIIISPHNEGEISIVSGMTKNITVKIIPENATNKTLAYSSTPGEVAAIDSSGSIRAGKVGNAVIKITAANGVKREIKVTVVQDQNSVASIEFEEQPADPVELIIGESYELKLKVIPETAANKTLNITSSNDSVAWPNGDGNRWIKADGTVGEATVTITSADNSSIKKEVRFKTKEKPTGPSISIETLDVEYESDEANITVAVKTLDGKLAYTPEVVGGGTGEKAWLTFVSKVNTDANTDTVHLSLKKNKTVWDRTAYIKFKDNNTNEYIISAGKHLEVNLTQKATTNPTVTIKWVDGIGEPTQAEKKKIPVYGGEKKVYWDDDKIFWWNETNETKWFNNRKAQPVGAVASDGGDGNQCWGKTASNMLHWWFVQNKENIDNYITKKNITGAEKNKYQDFYNRNYSDSQEPEKSYIAKTFRTKAHNGAKGDYIISGLSWYLYGNETAKISRPGKDAPALFTDVFSKENTPIERINVHGKDNFNEIISSALRSKKAIGIDIWGTKGGNEYGHAITLWGAGFDEEGNILIIYVVDNNFKENRIFPYGIWYKEGKPYLFNYGVNGFVQDRYVGQVTTLDKGEELWKEWLDKNK